MNENPLSKVRPGRPPAELRERVIREATLARLERRSKRAWSGFDLGLAAALLLLLACHALLSLNTPGVHARQVVTAESHRAPPTELQSTLGLAQLGVKLEAPNGKPAEETLTVETVLRAAS